MIRSNALRSTMRSLTTGKALARHGSIVIVSPSLNCRMWSWQTVVAAVGPVRHAVDDEAAHAADALAAVGVERDRRPRPARSSPSLTTSSISRNDMSGETSSADVVDQAARAGRARPGARFSVELQIPHDRLGRPALLVAPLRRVHFVELERLLVQRRAAVPTPVNSQAATYEKFSSSRSASPSGVWLSSRKWPPHDSRRCERVEREQFGELEVVGHAAGVLEALVEVVRRARHRHVLPELLAQLRDRRRARACRPASVRAMPTSSHSIGAELAVESRGRSCCP